MEINVEDRSHVALDGSRATGPRPTHGEQNLPLPFDDEHAPLYTVGQVAGMLNVQPAFLRRIDLEEVVQPARSDGGHRRYSRAEIALVQRVSDMADEGMSLAGIKRILALDVEVADLKRQLHAANTHRQTKRRHT
jgi:MerR family transcriptional regulator/heat shock protein HspR